VALNTIKQSNKQTNKQTSKQTNKQTNKQANKECVGILHKRHKNEGGPGKNHRPVASH
jgi:hypothetical protein